MSQGTLFNLNKNLNSGGGYINPGIHENVQCLNMTVNDDSVDIFMELEDGNQTKDRIFFPTKDKVRTRNDETQDQAFARAQQETADRMTQYAQIFLTENERKQVSMQADSVSKLATILAELLNPRFSNKKVDIKLVPSKDKETGKMKYTNFPYFPLYIVEAGNSSELKFSRYEQGLLNTWLKEQNEEETGPAEQQGPLY